MGWGTKVVILIKNGALFQKTTMHCPGLEPGLQDYKNLCVTTTLAMLLRLQI